MTETSSDWARIRSATRTRGLRDELRLRQRWFGSPFAAVEPFVPRAGDILDLGCGFGVLGAWLALTATTRRIVGLDVDERKIDRGRAWYGHLPNLRLEAIDLGAVALPPAEAVVIYDVLHHLPDADATLAAAARALRPGGVLVVKENDVTPAWKHALSLGVEQLALGSGLTRSAPVRFRPRDAWIRAIESTGLRVIHATHLTAREGFFVPHSLFVAVRDDDRR